MPSEQLPDSEEQIAFAFARTIDILLRENVLTRVIVQRPVVSSNSTVSAGDGLFMYKEISVVMFISKHTLVVMHSNAGARADKALTTIEDVPHTLIEALDYVAEAMERKQKSEARRTPQGNKLPYEYVVSGTGNYTSNYIITTGTWNAI